MYVESVPNRSSPPAVLLRESYRDRGRVKKRTLANLSKLPAAAVEAVRRVLRGERLVAPEEAFTCVRSLPHGHIAAVLGVLKQLEFDTLIARGGSRVRDLVMALIVARVIDAQSKLATARALTPESAVSTLGEALGLGDVDQHELYAAMDWLVQRQAGIEQRLAKRHLQEHTLVLYDLTSSYVEGTHCPLAQRGHSRDGKKGTLQIVFGLLCTAEGCPVAVEFTLTRETQRKRLPVHCIFVALLLVSGGLVAWTLLSPAAAASGIASWFELVRLPMGALGFALTSIFYIRWTDQWFRQHADQEFRLQQLALDVDRAGYATEMLLEWQENKSGEMPGVLLDRLTTGLFTDQTTVARARHPTEDIAGALLKASSSVRLDLPGIGEVNLTGRQIRGLNRKLTKETDE